MELAIHTDFLEIDRTSETQVLMENLPAKATADPQVTAHKQTGGSAKKQ